MLDGFKQLYIYRCCRYRTASILKSVTINLLHSYIHCTSKWMPYTNFAGERCGIQLEQLCTCPHHVYIYLLCTLFGFNCELLSFLLCSFHFLEFLHHPVRLIFVIGKILFTRNRELHTKSTGICNSSYCSCTHTGFCMGWGLTIACKQTWHHILSQAACYPQCTLYNIIHIPMKMPCVHI